MRTMTLGIMIGIIAAVLVPAVATADLNACDPTYTLCANDGSYAYGDCTTDGYAGGYDSVSVWSPAGYVGAGGSSYCGAFSGYTYDGNSIYVYQSSVAGYSSLSWYSYGGSFGSGCSAYVYDSNLGFNDLGCPAGGPPNPGWGSLTP